MALAYAFVGDDGDTGSSGMTIGPTSATSTTAYKGLVVWVKHEGAPTTISLADSQSNTWTELTKVNHGNGDISSQMFYTFGSGGSGITTDLNHTVTVTLAAARSWKKLYLWKISADDVVTCVSNAENTGSGTAKDAGTLTTTAASVSFMGASQYTSETHTASSGWTEDNDDNAFAASRSDASGGSIDPSCTSTGGDAWTANAASFQEGAAAGGTEALSGSALTTNAGTSAPSFEIPL